MSCELNEKETLSDLIKRLRNNEIDSFYKWINHDIESLAGLTRSINDFWFVASAIYSKKIIRNKSILKVIANSLSNDEWINIVDNKKINDLPVFLKGSWKKLEKDRRIEISKALGRYKAPRTEARNANNTYHNVAIEAEWNGQSLYDYIISLYKNRRDFMKNLSPKHKELCKIILNALRVKKDKKNKLSDKTRGEFLSILRITGFTGKNLEEFPEIVKLAKRKGVDYILDEEPNPERFDFFYSYEEAIEFLSDKGLGSIKEYKRWRNKNLYKGEKLLPPVPKEFYADKWDDWDVFLSKHNLPKQKIEFMEYDHFIDWLIKEKINNRDEYKNKKKEYERKGLTPRLPGTPYVIYEKFPGFRMVQFMTYNQFEEWVIKEEVINDKDFRKKRKEYFKNNSYPKIPQVPRNIYEEFPGFKTLSQKFL